jgi:radical SAM family uncharacterized protein
VNNPNLRSEIERFLLSEINLPGQYIGGELGSIVKPKESVKGRFCFCFPDVYTVGMSHYGLQLLYSIMNRQTEWACERCFTPYPDMTAALQKRNLPLYSLETFTPLYEFDVIGFTLQYELSYTNVLTMLSLGKIPLHCSERTMKDPLVIAGGPSAVNPEPMSDFIDIFVIGDGEETLQQVCDFWLQMKHKHTDRRKALLETARQFDFAAVPQLYSVEYDANGRAKTPKPTEAGVPAVVRAATLADIEKYPPPIHRIIPLVECIQDRVAVEVMRGCPGRCKFCISTVQKRPLRYRSPEHIAEIAEQSCLATGSEEVSLLSLSTSDYPKFDELMELLRQRLTPLNVSISVPSLRVNHQLSKVMSTLTTERHSGLTVAPEAALDSMRQRIGKHITNENLRSGCKAAFENGFNRVKMYFLCGLPEETPEDIGGIIDLCREILQLGKQIRGRSPVITANVSNFVSKPHTPWERVGMQTQGYFLNAHRQLIDKVRRTGISLKYHSLETSLLEALLCRGDRRLGKTIERAWQLGAVLDGWSDYFRGDCWEQAILETKTDTNMIIHTAIPDDAELPWGYVRFGGY